MYTELPLADELAAVFARMSGLLLSTETVNTALELITALAKETVPNTDGAGVTLLDEHGDRVTAAATDPLVSRADRLQYELDEGPCLIAWERRTLVRVDDLTREDRWPRWTAQAYQVTGMRAVLSVPLVAGDEGLGALKVYSRRPGAYGDREEHLLTMFAAHAAVLLANVRSYEDAKRVSDELRDSVRGRDLINIAKGVLMAREATDERTAFLRLTGMAREQGKPLREVANGVTGTTVRRRR
jgi:GAF domain-containing protein